MELEVSQPVTLIRNNKFIYIEENSALTEEGSINYSSFQVFNLKDPIDGVSLSTLIVPKSHKVYYAFEVSEYNGTSAKVKISFIRQTHSDLINYLRNAIANLNVISENGLMDWIPIDTVTFRIIYSNAQSALNQHDNIDNALQDEGYDIVAEFGDVEWLTKKLHEMALLFQSKTDIPSDVLEGLFHSIFPRRVTTLNAIEGVGVIISAINERLRYRIVRTIIQKLVALTNVNNLKAIVFESKYDPDLVLQLIFNLWTLIKSLIEINDSYELLKNSDDQFRKIIAAEKPHYIAYIQHVDSLIESILTILAKEQYDLLPARLTLLIQAVEDLTKLTELISVKCSEHLKSIEGEEKNMKIKSLLHFGIAAFEVYYGVSKLGPRGTIQRVCEATLLATNCLAFGAALTAKVKLTKAIEQQRTTLGRLNDLHVTLTIMSNKGKFALNLSGEEMHDQRETLIEEFIEFRIQCKLLKEVLNDAEK